jgi:hypothetical protein
MPTECRYRKCKCITRNKGRRKEEKNPVLVLGGSSQPASQLSLSESILPTDGKQHSGRAYLQRSELN